MKPQNTNFKWFGASVILAMFLGFAVVSPKASAQEEVLPVAATD